MDEQISQQEVQQVPVVQKKMPVLVTVIGVITIIQSIAVAILIGFFWTMLSAFGSGSLGAGLAFASIIGVIIIGITIFISVSLMKGKRWARGLVIALNGLALLSGAATVAGKPSIPAFVSIVLAAAIVGYLGFNKEVKERFK